MLLTLNQADVGSTPTALTNLLTHEQQSTLAPVTQMADVSDLKSESLRVRPSPGHCGDRATVARQSHKLHISECNSHPRPIGWWRSIGRRFNSDQPQNIYTKTRMWCKRQHQRMPISRLGLVSRDSLSKSCSSTVEHLAYKQSVVDLSPTTPAKSGAVA